MTILELKSQWQYELTSIRPSCPSSALKANNYYSPPVSCSACGHSPAWQCHWSWRPSLRNLGTSRMNKGLHPALWFPPSASPTNPFLPLFTSSLVLQSSLISSALQLLWNFTSRRSCRSSDQVHQQDSVTSILHDHWETRKGHTFYLFTRIAIAC